MTRWLAMLAAALVLACAADAGAAPRGQKAQKAPAAQSPPLHLYLAKGAANACGEGCSEWIAAEGKFESDSAGRVIAFLQRHGARKLPVYFHSPGGDGRAAIAVGRFLRQRGMTAGVGATVPQGCESAYDQAAACRAAKRATAVVAADWRPDAVCNSACVYALIGAKVRQVPPAARLGVHSVRLTMFRKYSDGRVQALTVKQAPSLHKTRAAEFNALLRRYVAEMGIDVGLFDAAAKVPHEDIHYLSRDEVAAYRIDRRNFAETPWYFSRFASGTVYVGKWIVEAKGPERQDYRVSVVLLRCSSAHRAAIQYIRGLASDEMGRRATATLSIGKHKARIALSGAGIKQDSVDTGALFSSGAGYAPFDDIEAAAAQETIRVTETDPRVDTKLLGVVELSTHGLAEGIKVLRARCAQPARPSGWVDGTQVPYVPAQTGSPPIPVAPYGAYPVPELGLGTGGRRKK